MVLIPIPGKLIANLLASLSVRHAGYCNECLLFTHWPALIIETLRVPLRHLSLILIETATFLSSFYVLHRPITFYVTSGLGSSLTNAGGNLLLAWYIQFIDSNARC